MAAVRTRFDDILAPCAGERLELAAGAERVAQRRSDRARGPWRGRALLGWLVVATLLGCGRTPGRTEDSAGAGPAPRATPAAEEDAAPPVTPPADGEDPAPQATAPAEGEDAAPQATAPAASAGPAWVRSAAPYEDRPCEGEAAILPEIERKLDLGGAMPDHCELHALGPDGGRSLFVRTENSAAYDDDGNRVPVCTWEVFAVSPGPVMYRGSLYACAFAIQDGCIYDLDETARPSAPTACIDANGRLTRQ